MKKFLLSLFVANILTVISLLALDPPKPIEGNPSILAKSYSFGAGNFLFKFSLPQGWGIGNMYTSAKEPSRFTLFPGNGGNGCAVEIRKYDSEALAREALNGFKRTFKSVSTFGDGFEVELKNAWYCCKVSGENLIQTWYSLPKKKKDSAAIWAGLKNAVTVSSIDIPEPAVVDVKDRPAVEKYFRGWICHHPENKCDVLFETFPLITATKNEDPNQIYLLKFQDFRVSGYFFVKWDQKDYSTNAPFQEHMKEMLQDVQKLEKSQRAVGQPKFDLAGGYGFTQGNPYHLISIAGKGFLFGFAYKPSNPYQNFDINDLVNKIKCTACE